MPDATATIPREGGQPALEPTAQAGCRFSLYPMTDEFVSLILDSLKEAPADGLEVVTDDVSTYLAGEPEEMLRFVANVVAAAAGRTQHVACTLLLSRGCPGEGPCEPDRFGPGRSLEAAGGRIAPTGIRAAAHYSLYPLGVPDYMELIDSEIERARQAGVFARGEHFASRLEGDLAEVLSVIGDGWAGAAATHTVAHATISVGSPSRPSA